MKCHNCSGFDSMIRFMYVDKNKNLLTEGEIAAFGILHPEEKGKFYRKILLCGICYGEMSRQTNRVLNEWAPSTFKSFPRKTSPNRKTDHFYECPFCKTHNEPLRNTCKNCERVLFSTEYETKMISSSSFKAISKTKRKSSFDTKKVFSPLVVILAIAFIYSRGTEVGQLGAPTKQALESNLGIGQINGQSTYEWSDGTKYTGEFKGGLPHGKGTIVWINGQLYTGDFLRGQITGNGTMNYHEGHTFVGNFLNGKPHGQGTMRYANGSVYTGNWVNGERE